MARFTCVEQGVHLGRHLHTWSRREVDQAGGWAAGVGIWSQAECCRFSRLEEGQACTLGRSQHPRQQRTVLVRKVRPAGL